MTQIPKPTPQPAPPSPKRYSKGEKPAPASATGSGKGGVTPLQGSVESGLQNGTSTSKSTPFDDSLNSDSQNLKPKSPPTAVRPDSPQTGKFLSGTATVAKQPVVGVQMATGKSKLPVPVSTLYSPGGVLCSPGTTMQHMGVKAAQAQNLAARTEKALKTRLYLMQKTGPATFMVSGDNLEIKYRVTIGSQVRVS